jgi:predicted Zn-dependent protease
MRAPRSRPALLLCCAGLLAALGLASSSALARERTVLLSEEDDARVGREAAQGVEVEIGTLDDPELTAYVGSIGKKLLRAIARRSFKYSFRVADQTEPNAFALPGGYIFISRGLLELVNSEDELACVIGHEIAHVAKRHAAARQGVARGQMPLVSPVLLQGRMAAYSRDLEQTADHDGQILCAAAGYDPRGMATFLQSLDRATRIERGYSSNASFFDTHPTSTRRAAIASIQASELRWKRDPNIGDPRAALLDKIDGLPVGQRPESGIFRGDVFFHPDLDFKLRFPRRWRTANTPQMVGAMAPRGEAAVWLSGDVPPGDPRQVADAWARRSSEELGPVQDSGPFRVGLVQAWQLSFSRRGARSYVTFVPHRDAMFVTATRLRVIEAQAGESVPDLVKRTGCVWDPFTTAVYNGVGADHAFEAGELVKIAKSEPYTSGPKDE